MKDQNIEDELTSIRSLMERSARFISLSGLSGIMAGIYALTGAGFAYHIIYGTPQPFKPTGIIALNRADLFETLYTFLHSLLQLILIAAAVLVASIATGIYLSIKKAKKNGQSVWSKTARSLLFHTAIPLVTGGLFMLILLDRGYYSIVAPASLIFYGIALICGSHYTFTDVKYLGLLEIVLGLIAALYPGYGLIFWAMGFGVLHIIYGSIMHFKYDR